MIESHKSQMNETSEENETALFSDQEGFKWGETAGFVIEGILIPILAVLGIFGKVVLNSVSEYSDKTSFHTSSKSNMILSVIDKDQNIQV